MTATLFGSRGSGSAAVEMGLRTAGIPCTLIRASSWEKDSAYPELLKVNPLGQIPTIVLDDGTVLTESAAILIWLGLECPASGLLPITPHERAFDIRGLVYIAANCYSAITVCDFPDQWTTALAKEAHEEVRSAACAQLHRKWSVFADTFGARLENPDPGALAFLAVVVSQWSGTRKHLESRHPDFYAQLMRLESHPKLVETLREHRTHNGE